MDENKIKNLIIELHQEITNDVPKNDQSFDIKTMENHIFSYLDRLLEDLEIEGEFSYLLEVYDLECERVKIFYKVDILAFLIGYLEIEFRDIDDFNLWYKDYPIHTNNSLLRNKNIFKNYIIKMLCKSLRGCYENN